MSLKKRVKEMEQHRPAATPVSEPIDPVEADLW